MLSRHTSTQLLGCLDRLFAEHRSHRFPTPAEIVAATVHAAPLPLAIEAGQAFPPDWEPSEDNRLFAQLCKLDPDATAGAFRAAWAGKAARKGQDGVWSSDDDWSVAWKAWCLTQQKANLMLEAG